MSDIAVNDFVRFCERTIDGMVAVVDRLDDRLVNTVPPELPLGNTPCGLITHALAALEWWTGQMVCGHPSNRDRGGEFAATGTAGSLVVMADEAKHRIRTLAPELASATGIAGSPRTSIPLAGEWTVGACLLHAYEELAQHLGHLEITADLLLR